MKVLKFAGVILVFITSNLSFSQIKITDSEFKNTVTGPLEVCLETGFYGVRITLNSTIKNYDKIGVYIYSREKGDENTDFDYNKYLWYDGLGDKRWDYHGYEEFFPTSKGFKDRYGSSGFLDMILYGNYIKKYEMLFFIENCSKLLHLGLLNKEFKIVVNGYFEDGSESYVSNGVLKSKTLYKFSKEAAASEVFTFELKPEVKEEWERIKREKLEKEQKEKERKARYNKIIEQNSVSKSVVLGTIYPRKEILEGYKIVHKDLSDKKDFETLEKVEDKLLNLGDNWKPLKKALKEKTDPEEIKSIILKY